MIFSMIYGGVFVIFKPLRTQIYFFSEVGSFLTRQTSGEATRIGVRTLLLSHKVLDVAASKVNLLICSLFCFW